MLNENDVVNAVCRYLEGSGYQILRRCSTTDQGIDIIAKRPSETGRLFVEAKGGTSAREGSARFEKGFNRSKSSTGLQSASTQPPICGQSEVKMARVAMAFPDTPLFRDYLSRIKVVTDKLDFLVFLVGADHSVEKL